MFLGDAVNIDALLASGGTNTAQRSAGGNDRNDPGLAPYAYHTYDIAYAFEAFEGAAPGWQVGAADDTATGGIWVLALISKPLLFLLALVVGILVSTAAVMAMKQLGHGSDADVAADPAQRPGVAARA